MADDWDALRSLSGFAGLPDLEQRNATPHNYTLTPAQRAQVFARYRKDFEEFDYER